ncbi:MAG: MMPL family transporter [Planctomycetota bacterium]
MPGQTHDPDRPVSPLDKRRWGLSTWLWIAMAAALAMGMIPRAARRAVESNTNKAEDWLPASYAESADLRWFRQHFASEAFVLVSWEGCTLGQSEQLKLLEQKLAAVKDDAGWAWYPKIVTGPGTVEQLTQPPSGLDRSAAIARLEGALVGPEQVGAAGEPLGDESRTTCLLAFLSPQLTDNNREMRAAVDRIEQITHAECGVPLAGIHMGGPPVDNVTIDKEGERTLIRLAGLSGLVGIALSYVCFRSWKLTGMVFFTAAVNAGLSLAIVFYYGVLEVFAFGAVEPRFGKADAILMSMPAVVYVLALSGAIHLVNYYRDARREGGLFGAAERAVGVAWGPCALAAFTTAVGLGSLAASDILPIRKFGMFTAIGVLVAVAMLFALLPVMLHLFAPGENVLNRRRKSDTPSTPWYAGIARLVTTRPRAASLATIGLALALAMGLPQIKTSVQLLKLLDPRCDLITDYAWLEEHMGNLVPMEVIVGLDADRLRKPDEPALVDRSNATPDTAPAAYRLTMHERSTLVQRLQQRIEALGPVSKALSSVTFSPEPVGGGGTASLRGSAEYATSTALEESRDNLADYLQLERDEAGALTGRELWRISARVTALADVDYGQFVEELREQVQPILDAYQTRDALIADLARTAAKPLDQTKLCLLFRADAAVAAATEETTPLLSQLLRESAVDLGAARAFDVSTLAGRDAEELEKLVSVLSGMDVVYATSPADADAVRQIAGGDTLNVRLIDSKATGAVPSIDAPSIDAPSIDATYTGVVPVVYKTQRELLASLRESIGLATLLIAVVMVLVLRSPLAGIASMIPNVFPIVVVFGALGWLGIKVDIGIMMTASVALGVAVDDTLHFITWFGRGIRAGLDRQTATLQAFDRCATAMTQTTLIGGLGLAVFAASTFTPTQQFGCLMITMLGTALVGDLVLLPALLCGPLGKLFAPNAAATPGVDPPGDARAALAPIPSPEPGDGEPEANGPPHEPPATVPFKPAATPPARHGESPATATPHSRLSNDSAALEPEHASLRERLRSFRRPGVDEGHG